MSVLAANPGSLCDDVGIGKMVRATPPLVVIPLTAALVLEAIDLINGDLRAAPEVTPRGASLLRASVVAGLAFSLRG